MCKILLSINPEHVESILSGKKQYEFRKASCKEKVDKIVIYSTYPVMKVVGEVEVLNVLVNSPDTIWEKTSSYSGITKSFFDNYYSNRSKAVAFHLGKVHIFEEAKELSDYGVKNAPQSFVYVS